LPLAGSSGYAGHDFSARHLRTALEGSLRRLDTDYVDIYQLHGPRQVCDDDVLALMHDFRSEGKIRGFGVGLESLKSAMGWLDTTALSSIQIPFGVLDPEAAHEVIPRARADHVPVIVRGVFAGGCLVERPAGDQVLLRPGQPEVRAAVRGLASTVGVDALQIAAWFVTTHPGVTTVLVGTSSARHLEQSLRYVEARPPDEMLPLIQGLVARDASARTTDRFRVDGSGA
jgi:aryl-alcohol dehydrogenase-like predicted oxidoreductase